MKEKIQSLILKEIDAITQIPVDESYENAVDLIYEQVHEKGGKLITSGMGKAGQIALNIATTFSSTGTCAVYLHPSEAQHGDLGILKEDDVLLLLSNSGKTREIVDLITLAGNLHPGIQVICITGKGDSELAQGSDVALLTGGAPEICPLGLTPTTSTTLMTIIGDMIVVSTMEKLGFTKEEYSKRHHSGYLGKVARGEED
jgi:arabinose-5-phosphate isomerase